MSNLTIQKADTSLEDIASRKRITWKKKGLITSTLLTLCVLWGGNTAAESAKDETAEASSITAKQQQEMTDWGLRAHEALSKRLETRLNNDLAGMPHPPEELMDEQLPMPEMKVLPAQKLLCAVEPESRDRQDAGILLRDCYAGLPE